MSDREIFDEFIRENNLGRRFEPADPGEPVAVAVTGWREHFSTLNDPSQTPPIYLDFTDAAEVNAWSARHRDRYLIGVNAGLFRSLRNLFLRILADPRTLAGIGSPWLEHPGLPLVTDLGSLATQDSPQPTCPVRSACAGYLLGEALEFLRWHAAAHIGAGHIGFLGAELGTTFLPEVGWEHPETSAWDRLGPVMEWEADNTAAASQMTQIADRMTRHWEERPARAVLREPKDMFFFWAFAVQALLRVFGHRPEAWDDPTHGDGPPLPFRRPCILEVAENLLLRRHGRDLTARYRVEGLVAVKSVEEAFSGITGQPVGVVAGELWSCTRTDVDRRRNRLVALWKDRYRKEFARHSPDPTYRMSASAEPDATG